MTEFVKKWYVFGTNCTYLSVHQKLLTESKESFRMNESIILHFVKMYAVRDE